MTYRLLTTDGQVREGEQWPLPGAAALSLPSVSWLRHHGHSWSDGGWDDPAYDYRSNFLGTWGSQPVRDRPTGIAERLAGILHIAPGCFQNLSIGGTSIMDQTNGAMYYLHNTTKADGQNIWPWETPHGGVDTFTWGVNDLGTRAITGMLAAWPTQVSMWGTVWQHNWRSVIARSTAGGIFPAERGVPSNILDPTTGFHPSIVYGTGWGFVPKTDASGTGCWRTTTNGSSLTITVPLDYDTGYLHFQFLCPGSYYTGPTVIYGADGSGPYGSGGAVPDASKPAIVIAPTEVTQAPSSIAIATPGVTTVTLNGQVLKNRVATSAAANNNIVPMVARVPVPPTPGTTRTVTITVTGIPPGGWVEFDSWAIEAPVFRRGLTVPGNIAPPAWWRAPLYFLGVNTWPAMNGVAATFNADLLTVCNEWADPGICVADLAGARAGHELDYGTLYAAGTTPETSGGQGTGPIAGDGSHPHTVGARLFAAEYLNAMARSGVPSYRYAGPFDPDRGARELGDGW